MFLYFLLTAIILYGIFVAGCLLVDNESDYIVGYWVGILSYLAFFLLQTGFL